MKIFIRFYFLTLLLFLLGTVYQFSYGNQERMVASKLSRVDSLIIKKLIDDNIKQIKKDSLQAILKTTLSDSIKVLALHELYLASDSIDYAKQALKFSNKKNYKNGICLSLLDLGRYYYFEGQQDISLSYLVKLVKIAEETNNKKILVGAYKYIGFIYRPHNSFIALDYYLKSLALAEEIKDEIAQSYALSAIGNVHEGVFDGTSEKNKTALEYYLKSLEIRERKGSYDEIASSLTETSRVYDLLGLHDKVVDIRLRGLEFAKKSGSTENIVFLYNLLGHDYNYRKNDFNKALEYQLMAYEIARSQKNNLDIMFDITKEIAYSYYSLGNFKKSADFFQQGIDINKSIREKEISYNHNLSGIKYELEKDIEKQKLLLKDSEILKEKTEAEKQTMLRNAFFIGFALVFILALIIFKGNRQKLRSNRELDIRNKKIEIAYQTLALSENKLKQITSTINDVFYLYNIVEKKYEYISPNSASLLGAEPQFFYDGNSMKHFVVQADLPKLIQANEKVDSGIAYDIEYRVVIDNKLIWIDEKSYPIFDEQNNLIWNSGVCRDITKRKNAEEILHKKNKDITDSINYASKIQQAILPESIEFKKHFPDSFVLFKPKDIVSGDFYWITEKNDFVFFTAADCTGHGVPGGFMSMLGMALLNEIVNLKDISEPSIILDKIKIRIIYALKQKSGLSETKDGMDMALCRIDKRKNELVIASANNPVWVIRENEFIEIKGDKQPVGISGGLDFKFNQQTVQLKKGDCIYVLTDGYADQFGGAKGKKFKYKPLKELLISMHSNTMEQQREILSKTMLEWKKDIEQVDDILLMGIKI
ncbi:MAG: SpoIIE family protein phosphatase [Bacteroidetes bacterium]|nr:SpoIIE family protein phosphatase [Bacteroidota bacterium]HET6244528.1 SpoIIE family protein phosphatase [Bacteroidia bacterium]